MRLTDEELQEIMKKNNCSRIWSWSRVNTFLTSPYEFLLRYIKGVPEDRQDCIYTSTGTLCHDTLDKYYENEIKYEDMIKEFDDGWLVNRDIAKLRFDRNDEDKDRSIGEKYHNNLKHFFKNHTPYKHNLLIEKPVVINVKNNIFVGYIDALFTDDNKDIHIIDFKSSSIYKGNTLDEHSGQLVLYALGLSQMKNIPISKIKCCFNFLKYCSIEYTLSNGTTKSKDVERYKIGESLQSNARMWLNKFGYEPDDYLKCLLDTNDISVLPKEVQDKYKITDCHVYIPLTDKLVNQWITTVSNTITDIEMREADYNTYGNDKVFWDSDESVKKQSYYFSTLCGYSANLHLPFKKYLEQLESKKTENCFDTNKIFKNEEINNSKENIDLSWLNNL